jgi:Rho family protein
MRYDNWLTHLKLILVACKCDLREDRGVITQLAKYGSRVVEYEEGLAVARRIRASRYLGETYWTNFTHHPVTHNFLTWNPAAECSSKHNRGVTEVFNEAARVSLATHTNSRSKCIVM